MNLADLAQGANETLLADDDALARLLELRGWTEPVIRDLGIGITGYRITIPTRNAAGETVNLLRYAPNPETRGNAPKLIATPDAPRDLFPAPESLDGDYIVLVEGEPDAITGHSLGIPACAIPGVGCRPQPERFANKDVLILFDSDDAGRKAADVWARALMRAATVRVGRWPQPGDDLTTVWRRDPEAFAATFVDVEDAAVKVEPRRIVSLPGHEFYKKLKPRNPDDDLLGPLLRRNTRTGIAGFIGEGKTSLMMQMVAASAYGLPFLKYRGRGNGTRWLILDLEQGESEIARRLEETGIKDRNGNVHYAHIPDGLRLDRDAEDMAAMEELLSKGWHGVALDPAYALWSSEPETERAAREMAQVLDRWHREHNFCLLVPMHTRKPMEQRVLSLGDVYGWSTITRNMQTVLGIQIWEPWVSKFSILKDRAGDIGPKGANFRIGYSHERLFHELDGAIPGQEEMAA